MKLKADRFSLGVWLISLMFLLPGAWPRESLSAHQVAVLDVETDGDAADKDWVSGAADFLEMALQKEGVITLDRRQIRLVLGERNLQASGLLAAETLRAAKLPAVAYFIGGKINRAVSNEFALTLSITRAETATVEGSFTTRGIYPADWPAAIESLAKKISRQLQIEKVPIPSRSEFESLTWLPEAALPFFSGLEHYAHGDYSQAIPWFRHACEKDKHFDQARLWQARAYHQMGLPEMADIALKQMKKSSYEKTVASKLPVIAVVAANGISNEGRGTFIQALAQSSRFEIFEPASIGATAREIDLQLTGQMAAPLNERSVWLVVDSVVFLDLPGNGELRARQNELLSGKQIRRATVSWSGTTDADRYSPLADAFLQHRSEATETPLSEQKISSQELIEPNSQDKPEVAFTKALRLVQAQPDRARYWIGLSDYYSEWSFRTWLLDKGVEAIERNRDQPDAAFWLASALWRKREMSRRVYFIPDAPAYSERPLTNDFAKLLEWFPKSLEATTMAETNTRGGIFTYSKPTDGRYLGAVFTNVTVAPVAAIASAASITEEQWLASLENHMRNGDHAKAWLQVSWQVPFNTPNVHAEAEHARDKLLKIAVREDEEFKMFSSALEQKQTERALKLGQQLLNCLFRTQRLRVIEKCGELIKQTKGFPAQFEFIFAQVEKYNEDFNFDPVTAAPMTMRVDFRLQGNPVTATSWANLGPDLEYARLMGVLAEEAQTKNRPDLSAKVFKAIRGNEALPLRNRLTATYDLALAEHEQRNDFEALELLKEVLRQTEGTGIPQARKTSWGSAQLESAAFAFLRKIRLYADADVDFCNCCGAAPQSSLPKPDNLEEMNRFFEELRKDVKGGVGGDNRSIKKQLVARKDQAMPAILYKLQQGEDVSHMLIFVGLLGSDGAAAVPYIIPIVCYNDRHENYNNAFSALGRIGKSAACAKPVLILATEDSRSFFNATFALEKVGPSSRRTVPYLAKLLYHKSAAVCEKAATEIIASAQLEIVDFGAQPSEQKSASLRKWWEEEGMKQEWRDTHTETAR